MATGWNWETVLDTMTIPRWRALKKEWTRHPPVGWLVAAFVGYKAPAEAEQPAPTPSAPTGAIDPRAVRQAFAGLVL